MNAIDESVVEQAALEWLEALGWTVAYGPDIGPGGTYPEREGYDDVVLEERLRSALDALNPTLPAEALEDAYRKLTRLDGPTLESRNRAFHRMVVDGVTVEYRNDDGAIQGKQASVVDFGDPANNDWLAANQFTVVEEGNERRPDTVLFVNGLPLVIIEFKRPTQENEENGVWIAYDQFQTYKPEIPSLFAYNEMLIASDGMDARIGTLTAGKEWFKRWRTIEGETLEDRGKSELRVMLEGVCDQSRFLALVRDFIVYDDDGSGDLVKKMAGYHQFHAVDVAVSETLRAAELRGSVRKTTAHDGSTGGDLGDQRIGVVWHTQGSGKSLTMAFYAGRLVRERAMGNPTIVVLTDRNNLDDQLFSAFSRCADVLHQPPVQVEDRIELRQRLDVQVGGLVFTTIQKFLPDEKRGRHPLLSDRKNIVVIADEAHRSQYDFIDGFARHMRDALPNASFIGFTGTPIELRDASTRAVFGNNISVYDIQRSVEDKATVPIYYESRLAKLSLDEQEKPVIDPSFQEVTEGEEEVRSEKLKSKWAKLEAVVGTPKRVSLIAQDILEHFESRLEVLDGKAMIVCMSRRICIDLYREIVRRRPEWRSDSDEDGVCKVVMTGKASNPADWQPHIRNKTRREALRKRFRKPDDPFRVVIVRDMWLTGFDAPSLHTMYIDKPMRDHGLMQAISRVNRVYKDKPGGLVVDYLGFAHELKKALSTYTNSGGKGVATLDQEQAVAVMLEKYEVCCGLFHGFDWSAWTEGPAGDQVEVVPSAQEHVLAQEDGKERCLKAVRELSLAFALAVPHEEALRIRDDVGFFQQVRHAIASRTTGPSRSNEELDHAVRQIVSRAVSSTEVLDVFAAAGLEKPDVSILSEEFLAEVKGMPRRNLAVELLQKLLKDELNTVLGGNVVVGRSFAEMLEKTIRRY